MVDSAGVMGVLAMVDDSGNELEVASARFREMSVSGSSSLSVDGRSVLSGAWRSFCAERADVPQKLMWMLRHRCDQVTEATVAILAGDAEISANLAEAEDYAKSEWDIASPGHYNSDGDYQY